MSDDLTIWPAEAPATLWNYDLLRPAADRPYPLPLMGMKPDWMFVAYYAIGIAIIALYAWRRFGKRTFDPSSDDYLVLKELSPTELRGTSKMFQAYLYYAGSLILIYSAFAFFGNVIVAALKATNIVGLQVSVDPSSFADRNWPITLALAFAGVTELFKPLDVCEAWLRRQSHRWVGIPIRVKARTERLLNRLDRKIVVASSKSGSLVPWFRDLPDWACLPIKERIGVKRLEQKFAQVEQMTSLIREPGTWPDLALLEKVKPLAKRVYSDAEAAMQQLEDVLRPESSLLAPRFVIPDGSDVAAAVHKSQEIQSSEPATANKEQFGEALTEISEAARKRRQQLAVLEDAIDKIERSRRETGALLAVYAERDERKDNLSETSPVGAAIRSAFPSAVRVDTGFWLLMLLIPIFFLYTLATGLQAHELLGNVRWGAVTVLATAVYETLRNAAIFLLPLLVVLSVRNYLRENGHWHAITLSGFNRDVAMQSIMLLFIAGFVALVGLTGVCLGLFAVVAENPESFQAVLFSGPVPILFYFLSYVFCAVAFVMLTLWAVDSLESRRAWWRALCFGLLNAAVVVILMVTHASAWNGWGSSFSQIASVTYIHSLILQILFDPSFYIRHNLTDFVAYSLIAFFSASLFAWPARAVSGKDEKKLLRDRMAGSRRLPAAAAVLLTMVLSGIAWPYPTHAGPPGSGDVPVHKRTVYLGVRPDAEPFSYKAGTGNEASLPFRGYSVDLCYQLFDSSGYDVKLVPVTADNRFEMLRKNRPLTGDWSSEQKVDVLCEATTLRYDRQMDSQADGIFSPLIFVSGVSYVMRASRNPYATDTYFAYIKGTTAEHVVSLACANDMFAILNNDESEKEECAITEVTNAPSGNANLNCNLAAAKPRQPNETGHYHVCSFASHDRAVEWFCSVSDKSLVAKVVYFGDREIILSKLKSAQAKQLCPENGIQQAQTSYTYEPYALLISKADPDLVQFVQRRVYDFFSHRSKAKSLFATYFPGSQMSPVLAYLFLLNSVDEEKYYQVPGLENAQLTRSNAMRQSPLASR